MNGRTEKLRSADVCTLKKMLKEEQITARKVLEVYKKVIENVNPKVNAIVEKRYDQALEEAKQYDETIDKEHLGKLAGVPITVKELFDVQHMQTTGGLLHRKGLLAKYDAEVVKRLKNEGAIIIGKTNTPELSFCQETDNKLYGRTNNPRDLTKTVGGSSGGEAAAIASGMAAAGIGSDIGGSIRFPSHFTGIIGFKSGRDQVSAQHSFPETIHPLQERMLGIGPMTKSVRDARLLYEIIADHKVTPTNLKEFTINVIPKTNFPLSRRTTKLLTQVYKTCREDYLVERKVPAYFNESAVLWQKIMSIEGGKMAGTHFNGHVITEHVKEKFFKNSAHHRYLSWALIGAKLFEPSTKEIEKMTETIEAGDQFLDAYLEKRILAFPVYHSPAPNHGKVYSEIFSIRKTFKKYMPYIAYANVWGLPSLTIPIGVNRAGLPIAIQLMSKNGNEDALFQLGERLENAFLGYQLAKL